MPEKPKKRWLLLIHQIPPKPNYLRVKIWRRLQQIGAVAIKQSVYAMPLSDQSREDLNWILKEIVEGGGDGSISEARFLEGLTDDRVIALFQMARKADYEKISLEATNLMAEWTSGQSDPRDPAIKGQARVTKLRRRLDDAAAIDFFQTPERGTVEILLDDLASRLSPGPSAAAMSPTVVPDLKGKVWVTRKNVFVDRIACAWLIRRFVDDEAAFKFVNDSDYSPKPGEVRFDMFEGEFTHEGNRCSFEMMIRRLRIQDDALAAVAEVIHDIDLKDNKFGRPETDGFSALLTGLVSSHPDDERRLEEGAGLYENLYAYFKRRKRE